MKYLISVLCSLFLVGFMCACGSSGQEESSSDSTATSGNVTTNQVDIVGAWEAYSTSEGEERRHIVIFTPEHYSVATSADGIFRNTAGGTWERKGDSLYLTLEFNTNDTTTVGATIIEAFSYMTEDSFAMANNPEITWQRLDAGDPGDLAGAWLITGRKRDGEISRRSASGPRKTMKILSGTRFQWIAYNTETAGFFGTGGGTYTTVDGIYTENIDFFSRDSSRVGASLEFNYELDSGEWHHSGLNSRGEPLYEIWSRRSDIEE